MQESRFGQYWVEPYEGIVYVEGWYWALGYEVQVTYSFGYNVSGTLYLDGRVHELAMLKAAQMFLSSRQIQRKHFGRHRRRRNEKPVGLSKYSNTSA